MIQDLLSFSFDDKRGVYTCEFNGDDDSYLKQVAGKCFISALLKLQETTFRPNDSTSGPLS